MSIIKSISSKRRLRRNKSLLRRNISNTKRRIRPCLNTVASCKNAKSKWTKGEKKSKTVSTKSLSFTTASKSPKPKGSIAKTSTNSLLPKGISLVLNWLGETISLLCFMKKSKSSSRLLPRVKQLSDKGLLILNYWSTKSRILKENSKYSWNKATKYLFLKIRYSRFSLNSLKKNSKWKRFLSSFKIPLMSIDAGILKALILMFMKWRRR